MKKRAVLLCGLLCLLLLTACGGKSTLEGWYLRAMGGVSLIITENNGPVVLSDKSEAGGLFDGLNSGDLIAVTCDGGIAESYPGQAQANSYRCLQGGDLNSIPSATLAELAELGYTPIGGSTADGWYLETVEGSEEDGPLLVGNGWPKGECLVDMIGGLFDGLESGDRIRVTYDSPGGPWPGVNWVFTCELLEKGALDDVPEEALTTMEEAGYDFGRHVHAPAAEPETVDDPVSGYCGNTITKVTVDGEEYAFWGGDSVNLTDILENLAYDPDRVCRCMTEFTVDTEFGTTYGVNLTESFARCEAGQADLTAEQVEAIRGVLARNCGGVTVTEAAGKPEEPRTILCIGDAAADLTDLLEGLSYDGGVCKCLPEYTVETSGGLCCGVNLTERYVRLEDRQAELTEAQAALLTELFARCGIV